MKMVSGLISDKRKFSLYQMWHKNKKKIIKFSTFSYNFIIIAPGQTWPNKGSSYSNVTILYSCILKVLLTKYWIDKIDGDEMRVVGVRTYLYCNVRVLFYIQTVSVRWNGVTGLPNIQFFQSFFISTSMEWISTPTYNRRMDGWDVCA